MKQTLFRMPEKASSKTRFTVKGLPFDLNSTQMRGNTSIAPDHIRKVSDEIALTTEDGSNIAKLPLADLGDIEINGPVNIKSLVDKLNAYHSEIFDLNPSVVPVYLGGNHLVTYPIIKTLITGSGKYVANPPYLLALDAHLDFYDEWEGERFTHCTVMKRIYDSYPEDQRNKIMIIGPRDIDIEERDNVQTDSYLSMYSLFGREGTSVTSQKGLIDSVSAFCRSHVDESETGIRPPLYISFDIDVMDPSVAPATGYPIPGGFSYWQVWNLFKKLSRQFNIIGFDFVEYAPNLDAKNTMTGFLAVKLIIEIINFINKNRK